MMSEEIEDIYDQFSDLVSDGYEDPDLCDDPECYECYPDDNYDPYYENDDDEDDSDCNFLEHSTSESPWNFNVPSDVEEAINTEKSKMHESYKDFMWFKLWPGVTYDEIDPLQSAADYYILFGLVNNSFVEFEPLTLPSFDELQRAGIKLKKTEKEIEERQKINLELAEKDPRSKLTELSSKANIMMHDLVNKLDVAFKDYVHMACGGELRHHKAFGKTLKGYRKGAWARWYYIFEQHGVDSLLKMHDLFMEFTPGSSYGGERWANAAKILYQREVGELGPTEFVNKQLFVDRVFTLEHNGGCFLNKLEWANHRSDREGWNNSFHHMKDTVLDAHASHPVEIDKLYGYASDEVQKLCKEYLELATHHTIPITGWWEGKLHNAITRESKVSNSVAEASKKKVESVLDWSDEEEQEKSNKKKNKYDFDDALVSATTGQGAHAAQHLVGGADPLVSATSTPAEAKFHSPAPSGMWGSKLADEEYKKQLIKEAQNQLASLHANSTLVQSWDWTKEGDVYE